MKPLLYNSSLCFKPIKVHYQNSNAVSLLASSFYNFVVSNDPKYQLAILCIGTDRSTGDSLGPIVGTLLTEKYHISNVFGSLDNPVHAVNLVDSVHRISSELPHAGIFAIDACLGSHQSIGEITLAPGSLKPGAGVNKVLPNVGDLHLTGVVNVGGFMEYFVLQNTRLSLVYDMANVIAQSIAIVISTINSNNTLHAQFASP